VDLVVEVDQERMEDLEQVEQVIHHQLIPHKEIQEGLQVVQIQEITQLLVVVEQPLQVVLEELMREQEVQEHLTQLQDHQHVMPVVVAEVQDLELLVQLDQAVVEQVPQDVEIQELLEQPTLEAVVVVLEEDRLMVEQVVQVSLLQEHQIPQELHLQKQLQLTR
jgi:hypothetical protein